MGVCALLLYVAFAVHFHLKILCLLYSHSQLFPAFVQESIEELGTIMDPLTASGPATVVGEYDLTQSLTGPADDGTASTRGLVYTPDGTPNDVNTTTVQVGTPGGDYTWMLA